jgi:2-polyprenyl-6-methoxyphenol hydroxylase-like FAD-dependent oxidoreductase
MTDVVIAGAGPVGLLLAIELRLGGASVLVLEKRAETADPLKEGVMGARALNGATASTLHRHGLLEAVRDKASWWFEPDPDLTGAPEFAGHFAGIGVRTALLDRHDPALWRDSHGGGVIALADLEEILERRALELGALIRRGAEVTGPVEGSRFLVGCDGGRSTVRKVFGFPFPGTDAEFVGRQALVEFDRPQWIPMTGWVHTEGGSYTHGPVPGRIHTVEYAPAPPRDEPVTAEELTASLRRTSGLDVAVTAVHVATRYTDMTRQASTYRMGDVFLAGDAAHVHSPAGGQGLNLGVGDAASLGPKLAAVVTGRAGEDLLDTYTAQRHPIGARVQGWSDAQTALNRPDPRTRALRAVVADLVGTTPGATYVLKRLNGVD